MSTLAFWLGGAVSEQRFAAVRVQRFSPYQTFAAKDRCFPCTRAFDEVSYGYIK